MVSLCPLEESKVKFVVVSDIKWSKVLPGAKFTLPFRPGSRAGGIFSLGCSKHDRRA